MKRTMRLPVEVDVVPDGKRIRKNGATSQKFHIRYDVKGVMNMIRAAMPDKNKQELLDEYAKFYILNQLGIKLYPLKK